MIALYNQISATDVNDLHFYIHLFMDLLLYL